MKHSIRRIYAVAMREFFASAASPAAWIFLVIFLILCAFCSFIISGVFASGQADLNGFFEWMPWLFLFIVPALGMPMWADERRTGTFELTLSFPAALWELIIGKYLGGMLLLVIALLLTLSTPLTAIYLGNPDLGAIVSGYLGALLIGSVFLSIACFCSAISKSQTASFLLSLLFGAALMFIGWSQITDIAANYLPQQIISAFSFCSILSHFQAFQRGILDTGEIVYALATTGLFLVLAMAFLRFAAAGIGNLFTPGTLSEPFTRKTTGYLLLTILLGLYAFFCINLTASTFRVRLDITSDHAYSLSSEARKVASSIETPAVIRYYVTTGNNRMPMALKNYAQRVEWLLREFCDASNGKLTLQMLSPEPDSIDEEAAVVEGIKPLSLNSGERIFLGLSISYADQTIPLPFLSPQQENMLEYNIARTLLNATRRHPPKVGVMSSFPVLGSKRPETGKIASTPMTPQEVQNRDWPWYIIQEISQDVEVVDVPSNSVAIPDVNALVLIHPVSLPPRTLYAIDQFVLRGGKLAVYLDSKSLYALLKTRKDMHFTDLGESDLTPLLSAWGIGYHQSLLVVDMNYATRIKRPERNITNPLILQLPPDGISRTDPLTASLSSLSLYYAAPLQISNPKPDLNYEVLLKSSENAQIINATVESPEAAIRHFQSGGVEIPLAVRISGKFTTAYPQGGPDAVAFDKSTAQRKESVQPTDVFLFGDVDMIFNDACVRNSQDALGQTTMVRIQDNLSLFQNTVEALIGSRELANIRSRVPMSRPLTKINEIKARAELAYKDRILLLQRNLLHAQERVKAIQNHMTASGGTAKLTQEQQQEVKEFTFRSTEFKRELKALNAQLKADLDRLDNGIKIFNILLVPLLVAIAGIIWSTIRLSKWRKRTS